MRYLLCFLFLALALPSCKKDADPPLPIPTLSNSEKILGIWTLTEELQDLDHDGEFVSILHPCDLDDTWTFKADSTLDVSQNGTTCDPGSPDSFTTKWELQDMETVLYLDFNAFFDEYKIAVLDDHMLVLHRPSNGTVSSKTTYKR